MAKKRGRKKKGRARKGRKVTAADLENLKKAQGKQTGPKTPEGKAISSMNNLKTGEHLRMFHRITEQAGKLKICQNCGDDVRNYCKEIKECQLQDKFIVAYFKAKAEKDPKYIHEITLPQLASMDMIFTIKLKYALDHIEDTYKDPKTGREKPVIDFNYILELKTLFDALNKSLEDMQLTQKSLDNSDAAWAALVDPKVDKEEAKEYLERIARQTEILKQASEEARKKRETDKDIQEYRKATDKDEGEDTNIDVEKIGDNPFGGKD